MRHSLACSCRADDLCARAEASSHPYKGLAAYSATKSFIVSWSRGLRQVRLCGRCSGVGGVVLCVSDSMHAVVNDDVCEDVSIMPLIPKGRVNRGPGCSGLLSLELHCYASLLHSANVMCYSPLLDLTEKPLFWFI